MSVSRGVDGPKILPVRPRPRAVELVAEMADDDPQMRRAGAAATLYANGWTYREIAAALGVSTATAWRDVAAFLQRSRRKFAA